VSDDGHVSRAVAIAQAGLVLGEDDVENPMQLVLYAPMAAHGLARPLRREPCRGDVIAGLETTAVGKLGLRFDANDRRRLRQAQLARETPLALKPVDLGEDADAALLDAAMALVEIDACADARRGGKSARDLRAQGRLIGFDREQIIGPLSRIA
jgi:hypothetical protein